MRRPFPHLSRTWPEAYPPHRAASAEASRGLDRQAEEEHGVPSLVLMEHASIAVARLACHLAGPAGRILVLCGPGNNGGDGYGAARFLASWGRAVRLLRCSREAPSSHDASHEVRWASAALTVEDAWSDPALVASALAESDLIVDALFGVGLTRDLDPPFPAWIAAVNAADALRLAVDVPSGLDANTGEARPLAVQADVTATMAVPKTGLLQEGSGRTSAGFVVEVDIGLPGAVHAPWRLESAP